jgi:hypothetical protein
MNTIKENKLILDYGEFGKNQYTINMDDDVVIVLSVPQQRQASVAIYLSEDDFIEAMLAWSNDNDTSEMSNEIVGTREWANEIALDDLARGSKIFSMDESLEYIKAERQHDTKIVKAMEEYRLLEIFEEEDDE